MYPTSRAPRTTHTFMGNTTTNAATHHRLAAGRRHACKVPGDKSGYWMPTMYNGSQPFMPVGRRSSTTRRGVNDYTSVRPFPHRPALRGRQPGRHRRRVPAPGPVEGWECGDSHLNFDFPATCPAGGQLNIRMQAPSCWDGLHLDTPDHQSHMAYPVNGVCPPDHPVAVPMIEFKMAWPVSGDMSAGAACPADAATRSTTTSSTPGTPPTLAALVTHCINGGLQCDARGYDETHAEAGAALDQYYQLPGSHTVLDRSGWTATASVSGDAVANMLDGNSNTRWTTGVPMTAGQSVTVDMHATNAIDQIFIDAANADYARGYQVFLSSDSSTWTGPVASGVGFLPQILATFTKQDARYIRVVQTGSDSHWWSITELTAAS